MGTGRILSAAPLLVLACGGRVDAADCLAPQFGSYEVTQTVVESDCPGEHPGDVSTGRVDLLPDACPVVDCAIVCSEGATETTWTSTGPTSALVTFAGPTCKVVYDATMRSP